MRALLTILLIFSCLLSGGVSAEEIGQFRVAGWFGSIQANDVTHQFQGCAVFAFYRNGVTLFFLTGPSLRWDMDLQGKDWQLKRGDSYHLSYAVDDGPAVDGTAVAHNAQLVSIQMPDSAALLDQIKAGQILHVTLPDRRIDFALDGAGQAMDAAMDCTRQRMNAGAATASANPFAAAEPAQDRPAAPMLGSGSASQSTNPFVPPQGTATTPQPVQETIAPPQGTVTAPISAPGGEAGTDAHTAEAVSFISHVLSISGMLNNARIDPKKYQNVLPGYHAFWEARGVIGAVSIIPDMPVDRVDTYITAIMSRAEATCTGRWAFQRPPVDDQAKDDVLRRLVAICDRPAGEEVFYHTIFARPGGGIYLMSILGRRGTDGVSNAEQADSKILAAVFHQKSTGSQQ